MLVGRPKLRSGADCARHVGDVGKKETSRGRYFEENLSSILEGFYDEPARPWFLSLRPQFGFCAGKDTTDWKKTDRPSGLRLRCWSWELRFPEKSGLHSVAILKEETHSHRAAPPKAPGEVREAFGIMMPATKRRIDGVVQNKGQRKPLDFANFERGRAHPFA